MNSDFNLERVLCKELRLNLVFRQNPEVDELVPKLELGSELLSLYGHTPQV